MLRVTLDLIPRGNEAEKRTLGTVEIENIGGDEKRADYAVRARGQWYADATLRRRPRERGWPFIIAALRALFGGDA